MLGGEDIIDTSDRSIVRCCLYQVWIILRLLGNLTHHSDETIESLFRLVLGRLNHQTLVEEQREVDGRSMIAVIQQALCHIHRGDTGRLILQTVEHELMTTYSVDRQFIDILQRLFDIVGIESGQRTHQLHVLTTQREDISVGTHHHSEVAMIRRHEREELLQSLTHTNGTRTRTTTSVRSGEGLVEVDMHHVETHVARTTSTKHRVQIGTIVIHQTSRIVDKLCDGRYLCLKETKGIRIGHHHRRDVRSLERDKTFQISEIDLTISARFHLDYFEAADSCRGRIGAVGAVRHNDFLTSHITTRTMIVVDNHQSCKLAMSTSVWLECEVSQTCKGTERLLEHDNQSTGTNDSLFRLQRMQVLELRQSGHLLIDLGIIFHRT